MAYGFIYKWTDKARDMYYIGSHVGDLDDGYISSSHWLNAEVRYRPEDFSREILKVMYEHEDLKLEEYKFLSQIHESEYGVKYYNLKHGAPKGTTPWNKGKVGEFSEDHRRKISEARTGQSTWNKGIPNPLAAENGRKGAQKLANTATGRKRLYLEDGSWTWHKP